MNKTLFEKVEGNIGNARETVWGGSWMIDQNSRKMMRRNGNNGRKADELKVMGAF